MRQLLVALSLFCVFDAQFAPVPVAAADRIVEAAIGDPSVLQRCSLSVDATTRAVTPFVTLAQTFPGTVAVHFILLDAGGKVAGTHDAFVEPPGSDGKAPGLASFMPDQAFASATCSIGNGQPTATKNASNNTVPLLGFVGGAGALVALLAHGSTTNSTALLTQHSPTPVPSPTNTGTATANPSESPTVVPSASPSTSASPRMTATPTPLPTSALPTPTGSPSPTPVSTALIVMPNTLTFNSATSQDAIASENNYSGMFVANTSSCAMIAMIAPNPSTGDFTVTPMAGGQCTYQITDSTGKSASLSISITYVNGGINAAPRRRGGLRK